MLPRFLNLVNCSFVFVSAFLLSLCSVSSMSMISNILSLFLIFLIADRIFFFGINDGGIHIATDNNQVQFNYISNNNPNGISFLGGRNNNILDNHISDNKLFGIYAFGARRTTISRNNLINNPTNAYF